MKFTSFSTTSLLGYFSMTQGIEIDVNSPMATFQSETPLGPMVRGFTSTSRMMSMAIVSMLNEPSSPTAVEGFVGYLSGYGCYCNPTIENQGKPRNGYAVDPIDQACKELYQCWQCLPRRNGKECTSDDGEGDEDGRYTYTSDFVSDPAYNFNFNHQFNTLGDKKDQRHMHTCHSDDQCGLDTCACAKRFSENMEGIFKAVTTTQWWYLYNFDNLASFGFDFDGTCVSEEESGPGHFECCGDFPDVVHYNPRSKSCCDAASALFNPAYQQCCEDEGTIASLADGCV